MTSQSGPAAYPATPSESVGPPGPHHVTDSVSHRLPPAAFEAACGSSRVPMSVPSPYVIGALALSSPRYHPHRGDIRSPTRGAKCPQGRMTEVSPSSGDRSFAQYRERMMSAPETIERNSLHSDLVKNADGSVDLYVGPQAPAGLRTTGLPPLPARRGSATSASMAPPKPISTGHGSCRNSKRCSDPTAAGKDAAL